MIVTEDRPGRIKFIPGVSKSLKVQPGVKF